MNQFPPSPEYSIRTVLNFSKIRGDTRKSRFATGFNDTGGKFAAGINDTGGNDTGGKFATAVNDTGGK